MTCSSSKMKYASDALVPWAQWRLLVVWRTNCLTFTARKLLALQHTHTDTSRYQHNRGTHTIMQQLTNQPNLPPLQPLNLLLVYSLSPKNASSFWMASTFAGVLKLSRLVGVFNISVCGIVENEISYALPLWLRRMRCNVNMFFQFQQLNDRT